MQVIAGIDRILEPLEGAVLAIGNFDGVHLGHRKILEAAVSQAKALGTKAVVFTFRPHPQVFLNPRFRVQLLNTYDEKLEQIAALGMNCVIEQPFSRDFSTISPERFFSEIVEARLKISAIVVGYDFAFGKNRGGDLRDLESFCKRSGIALTIIPQQKLGIETISSSRIRQLLMEGQIGEANRLLGRPFFYRGIVVRGEGRGRKIGFPTANLKLDDKLILPYGVYATRAISEGRTYTSVTNIGVRPTFRKDGDDFPALVETHLLDANLDLYGKVLEVRFVERIRDERKFDGIDQLRLQIAVDVEKVKNLAGFSQS